MRSFGTCLLGLILLITTAGSAFGQQNAAIIEVIEQRIASLRSSGISADDETLRLYVDARKYLSDADRFSRDAEAYRDLQQTAPQRQSEIQARIDGLADTYDPSIEVSALADDELEERLVQVREALNEARASLENLDRRLSERESDATSLRNRLQDAIRQLETLRPESLRTDPDEVASLSEATALRLAALRISLQAEIRALESALASQPARFSLMAAERVERGLNADRLAALTAELELRIREKSRPVYVQVDPGVSKDDPAYSIARSLAAASAAASEEERRVSERLVVLRSQRDEIARRTRAVGDRLSTARRMVEFASENEALGRVLLKYWEQIDQFAPGRSTTQLTDEASKALIQRIDNEETFARLLNSPAYVTQLLTDARLDSEALSEATRERLLELTRDYREQLRITIATEMEYIQALTQVDQSLRALSDDVQSYRRFLEGLVLWIPNRPPLWKISPGAVAGNLKEIAAAAARLKPSISPLTIVALIIALAVLLVQSRLAAYQQEIVAASIPDSEMRTTFITLGVAAVQALPIPLFVAAIAGLFTSSTASQPVADTLVNLATMIFVLDLVRRICAPGDIAETRFGWRAETTMALRVDLPRIMYWWLPVLAAAALANQLSPSGSGEALTRVLMLVTLLMVSSHLLAKLVRHIRGAAGYRLWSGIGLVMSLLIAIVLLLLIALLYGQVHAIEVAVSCLLKTTILGIGLVLAHSLTTYWLRLAQSRLKQQEGIPLQATGVLHDASYGTSDRENLVAITDDSLQLVNAASISLAVASVAVIWSPFLPIFRELGRITLWTYNTLVADENVSETVTLATVLLVIVLVSLTIFAARKLPALLEIVLRSYTSASSGARYTTNTLLKYLIIGAGIITALSALGLRWRELQWLIAALGVGIGFGLQEIVANFISGIIILFERPIRVGDIVTVGDKDGRVTKIRIRATALRDWDGKELLVPNKEFITGRLLNWTLSDKQTRIVIPVGITYGSDVVKALDILRGIVDAHPNTLDDPAPVIVFEHFGDNSLELSARCFVDSLEVRWSVMTDLRMAINEAFKEAGIVIAFPQRDVHLDINGPLNVVLDSARKD